MTTPARRKVVVVDDERPILLTLGSLLERNGYAAQMTGTVAAGLAAIRKDPPDVVLLDLGLPDGDGLDVLRSVRRELPQTQVIILTANDSLANAIESIKEGAFHFISKPYAPEELLGLMGRALEQQQLLRETVVLREEKRKLSDALAKAERRLAPVVKSRSMQEIQALLERVAPTDANVLLLGESGVGKEVLANEVHRMSKRRGGPLVKLNCAAFPANMIEAELFGYVKGAFTGAVAEFRGMIAESSGGTLFLDEIAEMPAELQTRFLRVLQDRAYRPLGSTKTVPADFRLVAATNRPIVEAVRAGTLRQDLYYRLNTFQIPIPPLRERREDIPALISLFTERFAQQLGKTAPVLAPDAIEALLNYTWPGNIRELQNAIEYAVVLTDRGMITPRQLPREIQLPPALQAAAAAPAAPTLNLGDHEKQTILQALAQTGGNKKKAAQILGIHRPTLYGKMKRLGIEV